MRAPRCVSAFPITNLKRRRLRRQSSFPLSAVCDRLRPLPVPILLRAAFPFSPLAPIPLPALRSLFYHSLPPRSHGCVPVAARNCSCISRPRQRRKKKREEGREERGEELGAQVQFEERRGTGMKFESWERRRFRRF